MDKEVLSTVASRVFDTAVAVTAIAKVWLKEVAMLATGWISRSSYVGIIVGRRLSLKAISRLNFWLGAGLDI
ncbi:hypothetical protein [Agrobacterium pusense]|uniref:hypothetical protein n=1 Tax=Agrobacterium pusense TaxID=648995 RepID=UPI0028AC21AE|nr:hypothetical protein [Agrobacterium pusense]